VVSLLNTWSYRNTDEIRTVAIGNICKYVDHLSNAIGTGTVIGLDFMQYSVFVCD